MLASSYSQGWVAKGCDESGWVIFLHLELFLVSHLRVWKISPQNLKFFNFFSLGSKIPGTKLG